MKKIIILITIAFFSLSWKVLGQINEFIIESYFYWTPSGITHVPWLDNSEPFFRELKSYNFNTVHMRQPEKIEERMASASKAGLNIILQTSCISSENLSPCEVSMIKAELNNHSKYNVKGYLFSDEPDVRTSGKPNGYDETVKHYIDQIPHYSSVVKEFNPNLIRQVNFKGRSRFKSSGKDAEDYPYREELLQRCINSSQLNLISFDDYPIAHGRTDDFFISMYDMALKSVENKIPFLYVLTPYSDSDDWNEKKRPSDGDYHAASIEDFRYMIYAAVAYGAKGIAYWPGFEWVVNAFATHTFKLDFPEATKKELKEIHAKLIRHSNTLLSLNFAGAYHMNNADEIHTVSKWNYLNSNAVAKTIFNKAEAPIKSHTPSLYKEIVLTFHISNSNELYFWAYNKSNKRSYSILFDTKDRSFWDVFENTSHDRSQYVILKPGEARLFKANISTYEYMGVQTNQQEGFRGLYAATKAFIGNENAHVQFAKNCTESFSAEEIYIRNAHIKQGSLMRFISYKNTSPFRTHNLPEIFIEDEETTAMDDTNNNISNNDIIIYPNPTNDLININLGNRTGNALSIGLYNMSGLKLSERKPSGTIETFEMYPYPQGMYIIKITSDNGESEYHKFIYK